MPEIITLLVFRVICGVCYVFSKMCTYPNEQVNNEENDYIMISKADFENLQKRLFDANEVVPPPYPHDERVD